MSNQTPRSVDEELERQKMLEATEIEVGEAFAAVRKTLGKFNKTREIALAITNLEQAEMWTMRHVENML